MPEKKTMQFANFNITFGETPNPKPMLTYLKEIIFPTFKNEYIRGDGGETQCSLQILILPLEKHQIQNLC